MSISRQNLSIVIVTYKSEMVIHDCYQLNDIKIIVVENSIISNLKRIRKNYANVSCVLSSKI